MTPMNKKNKKAKKNSNHDTFISESVYDRIVALTTELEQLRARIEHWEASQGEIHRVVDDAVTEIQTILETVRILK